MRRSYSRELSVAGAVAGLVLVLAIRAPGFLGSENVADIFMTNVPVQLIAIGMTLVILTGQIDISVGSLFAVCSVAAGVFAKTGMPAPVAGVAACVTGALLGALNGGLVAYLRVPSIVATLAAMVALRDGLRWATQGAWIEDLPAGFQWLGFSQRFYPAVAFFIAGGLSFAAAWALRNLAAGRAVYATGSNEEAARLTGIDTRLCTFSVFTLTGALTGLAALLNSVRFNQIPSNAGLGLEMKVIAAVVVGGTAITGGTGRILGTVLGVILLGTIGPALTFFGINAYWEKALQGVIILAAITADGVRVHFALHGGRKYASSTASSRA
jgi:rhamnose transport system permease protein